MMRRRAAEAPHAGDRLARRIGRAGVVIVAIAAIAGTLSGCGRYGRPKRPVPEPYSEPGAFVPADPAVRVEFAKH